MLIKKKEGPPGYNLLLCSPCNLVVTVIEVGDRNSLKAGRIKHISE